MKYVSSKYVNIFRGNYLVRKTLPECDWVSLYSFLVNVTPIRCNHRGYCLAYIDSIKCEWIRPNVDPA